MRRILRIIITAIIFNWTSAEDHRSSRQRRVVGSSQVSIFSHPYIASLRNPSNEHYCGGSIISPWIILTAAHCLQNYPSETLTVKVGSDHINTGGSLHRVSKKVLHENYQYRIQTNGRSYPVNDIGLLKLESPIALDYSRASTIQLFQKNEQINEYSTGIVVGWGLEHGRNYAHDVALYLEEQSNIWKSFQPTLHASKYLKAANLQIISRETCSRVSGYEGLEDQICTYSPGKGSCLGDSGGPLVVSGRQAGIISWGEDCNNESAPGVYTEVAAFYDWIVHNMRILRD
ncbi:hypothetical protein QAD02_008590 [Eretmocerus hayati]|uniref:Uncharacterized protein n=1 Tax=Eretmocerus hayati TaxID=131215 RepID=A0ACC2N7I7_9HYME|nr:hypothetical protein QAD02_008590 [Eretmocerus hayati]